MVEFEVGWRLFAVLVMLVIVLAAAVGATNRRD